MTFPQWINLLSELVMLACLCVYIAQYGKQMKDLGIALALPSAHQVDAVVTLHRERIKHTVTWMRIYVVVMLFNLAAFVFSTIVHH